MPVPLWINGLHVRCPVVALGYAGTLAQAVRAVLALALADFDPVLLLAQASAYSRADPHAAGQWLADARARAGWSAAWRVLALLCRLFVAALSFRRLAPTVARCRCGGGTDRGAFAATVYSFIAPKCRVFVLN